MRASYLTAGIIICILSAASYATDGIAVSAHGTDDCHMYSEAGQIIRYDIQNDDVISETVIYPDCGRFAAFNKKGTHVAFFMGKNCSKGTCGQWSIATMTIDGTDVTELIDVPNGSSARLAWSVDNWIYYRTDSDISRVNADNPAQIEKIATFSGPLGENFETHWWGMDAYGSRISIGCERNHVRYVLPGNGALSNSIDGPDYVGYGCNNIISPSGNMFAWTVDAGHSAVLLRSWDSNVDYDRAVTWEQYNSWAVNASTMATTCPIFGQTVTVGIGFEGNRWSANSDKWICLGLGFPPEGRFAKCGKNQVLINWEDQKTIMVSFNPRASCKSDPEMCDLHTTEPRLYNEAGDFYVLSPAIEVNEDLRTENVSSRNMAINESMAMRARALSAQAKKMDAFDIRGRKISSVAQNAGGAICSGIIIDRGIAAKSETGIYLIRQH